MPIYKYVCKKCGSHVEVIQKISDAPLKRCHECRGKMEKIVSRTSFQLKGGGWYKTDYPHKTKPVSADKAEKSPDKEKSLDKVEKSVDKKAETASTTDAK